MPSLRLEPAAYINTQDDLKRLVDTFTDQPLIAIDTESNNLHAYQEQVCLIQISSRSADYIIDPLAVEDLQPLAPLLASETIEKIFHAAEYDIMTMKRDFGFEFANLFDTMAAARICGFKSVGLGSLLEDFCGVSLDKRHQRDNWGKRPLSTESLMYAQMDTHFLPLLRDEFVTQLEQSGHTEEAREVFAEICNVPPAEKRTFDPDGFWRIVPPNSLRTDELLILRELYILREKQSMVRDVPAYKVLNNHALLSLACNPPGSISDLRKGHRLSSRVIKSMGKHILQAVERGRAANKLPPRPRNPVPDPETAELYAALHAWRKNRAIERGVESDVIISKNTLWNLANHAPVNIEELREIQGIGPWRLNAYGNDILNVIQDCVQMER